MSALGFYSVCPGSNQYVIGSPLFPKAKIHFPNGKTLQIVSKNNNHENVYVQNVNFNGADYTKNFLLHNDLQAGGEITYQMGNTPNKNRGTADSDAPYSFSTAER